MSTMSSKTRNPLLRWLSLTAVLALCLACFAGCGGTNDPVSGDPSSETGETGETGQTGQTTTQTDGTTGPEESEENPFTRPNSSGGGEASGTTESPYPTVPTTPPYDSLKNFPKELSGQTVQFLTWFAPDAVLKKQIEDFTAKTGINISVIQTTFEEYPTTLAAYVGANMAPDVASIQPDWWPSLIVKNFFQDISVGDFDLKNDPAYDKTIMDLCSWGGKYYGVAVQNSTWCNAMQIILYNKTRFQRKGLKTPTQLWNEGNWNWDTYLDAAKALTETIDGVPYYGTQVSLASYMLSANTDFVRFETAGGKTRIVNNLADPTLEKAWKFYIQTRHKDKVEMMDSSDFGMFLNGRLAMVNQEDYYLLYGRGMEQMTDEWGAVPFPSPAGQEPVLASAVKIWGIPTGAASPRAASYFIRYFLDPNTEPEDVITNDPKTTVRKFQNDEAEAVFYRIAAMKKNAMLSKGVVGYNTISDYWDLFTKVAYGEYDQVGTNLKAWSNRLDAIIETIENAMPK